MKKILIVCLLLLVSVIFATGAYAADNKRAAEFGGIEANAVTDASSGNCAEVDTNGSLQVEEAGYHESATSSTTLAAGNKSEQLITNTARVFGFTVTGVSAGDWAEIYEGTAATRANMVYDPNIGTAVDTLTIPIPGGVTFTDGVYTKTIDDSVIVTAIYKQ